jgi:transposase
MHPTHASRRRHPAELKDKVLTACEEPGASVAAVAQAHGLNANLVHKWRRCQGASRLASTAGVTPTNADALSLLLPVAAAPAAPSVATRETVTAQRPAAPRKLTDATSAFVPLQLEMPRAAPADIRLELRRGTATVIVKWPAQEAAACGSWLREWLG